MKLKSRKELRQRRHRRVRRKIAGTAERPRMSVMKSNQHLYVQFIDDDSSVTVASASTLKSDGASNLQAAADVGRRAAEDALSKGIKKSVVDRGGFRFQGRIKAVVDAAREAGIEFGVMKEES